MIKTDDRQLFPKWKFGLNTYIFVGHSAAKTAFTLPHWI